MAKYLGWKILIDEVVAVGKLWEGFGTNCIKFVSSSGAEGFMPYGLLNGAVGSMYAREHLKSEQKQQLDEIAQYVQETFKALLSEINWINARTKQNAITKLEAMKHVIGYPNEYLDRDAVDTYYKGI